MEEALVSLQPKIISRCQERPLRVPIFQSLSLSECTVLVTWVIVLHYEVNLKYGPEMMSKSLIFWNTQT